MHGEVERRLTSLGRRGRRSVVAAVARREERVSGCWFPRAQRIDQTSMFEIGSVTKAFTGVLLADMVLTGEVALDDPLSRHLPGLRPAWPDREPTLLELATHRSGLPNTPGPMSPRELTYALGFSADDPWAWVTLTEYQRLVAREAPRGAPGQRFRYSSMAVGLLGDALAARAGSTYGDLLAKRVLHPLGLRCTGVEVPPAFTGHPVAVTRGAVGRDPRSPTSCRRPAACAPAARTCCASSRRACTRRLSVPAPRSPLHSGRTRASAAEAKSGSAG